MQAHSSAEGAWGLLLLLEIFAISSCKATFLKSIKGFEELTGLVTSTHWDASDSRNCPSISSCTVGYRGEMNVVSSEQLSAYGTSGFLWFIYYTQKGSPSATETGLLRKKQNLLIESTDIPNRWRRQNPLGLRGYFAALFQKNSGFVFKPIRVKPNMWGIQNCWNNN